MRLEEARAVIADQASSWVQCFEATQSITRSREATWEDLIACLRLGGVCASCSAIRLHQLTNREQREGPIAVYLDPEEWIHYLVNRGLLEPLEHDMGPDKGGRTRGRNPLSK
jgi:hypothetical protein